MIPDDIKPLLEQIAQMPVKSHWPDRTKPFDYANSQVIAFIQSLDQSLTQSDAIYLYQLAGRKFVILFDPDPKIWIGNENWKPAEKKSTTPISSSFSDDEILESIGRSKAASTSSICKFVLSDLKCSKSTFYRAFKRLCDSKKFTTEVYR